LVVQYGIIGFLFMLIGVFTQWRKLPINICIGLIACFLCNTVVLVGLLKFDFDLVHQNIFRVYPVIAYAVVAIWIATGVHSCVQLLNSTKYSVPGPEVMRVLLTVLVIGTSLLSNIPKNYRAKDSLAHDYALGILESLEKGAIFFTFADNTVGPMAYLNKIEGVRPDITLYNSQGLVYSNRLYRFSAASDEKKEKLDKLISTSQRPVYYMGELDHQYANYHMGLYLRVDKTSTEKTTVYQYNEQILNSFLSLIAKGEPVDPWESMMYKLLVSDYCRLSAIYAKEGIQADEEIDSWYDENCRTYLGYLEYTEVMLEDEEPDWSRIKALLDLADVLSYEAIAKEDSSRVQYYRGLMYSALNELELAVESHNRSLQLWSHPKNPSNSKLRELMSNRESG
jgi:hypothetical protein